MLGSVLYLVGRDAKTNNIITAAPCTLCRRFILNAGIEKVICRTVDNGIEIINVTDWIDKDDSLPEGK